jgi:hypothetical protein
MPKALIPRALRLCHREVRTHRVEHAGESNRLAGIDPTMPHRTAPPTMAAELDEAVEAFRTRPLDAAPYTYVWLDVDRRAPPLRVLEQISMRDDAVVFSFNDLQFVSYTMSVSSCAEGG